MVSPAKSTVSRSGLFFREAKESDVEALTRLINAAFVVERVVFEGDRVDAEEVRRYVKSGTFLVMEDAGALMGCVYVELREGRGYLGLLSVEPTRQGKGLGLQLVMAAEDFARRAGARWMELRVISARAELLTFYRRAGYEQTGTAPFAPELKAKVPSHYILMSKALS